jgi:hypothetical protein
MRYFYTWAILVYLVLGISCQKVDSPDRVVENFAKAIQQFDVEKIALLVVESDTDTVPDLEEIIEDDDIEIIEMLLSRFTYKIGESKIDNEKAVVKIAMSGIDMSVIVAEVMKEVLPVAFGMAFSGSEPEDVEVLAEKYMKKAISEPNVVRIEREIDAELVRTGKGWKIVPESAWEICNIALGNIESIDLGF